MRLLVAIVLASLLSGCLTYVDPNPPPQLLKAVGYGAVSDDLSQSPAQRRLLGMRAAKLDAYRNLAEQVYGLQVTGQSTVSDVMVRNDRFHALVDTYLRGARVVTTTAVDEATYEVIVELELSPDFYDCVHYPNRCTAPAYQPARTCNGCDSNFSAPDVQYSP